MPGVPPGRRVLEFGPCDGFILMSSFAAVPDAASLCVVPYSTRTETTWETRSRDRSFLFMPPRPRCGREPYFWRAPNQKLPTRTLPLPTRTTSMPQPRKQQKHLKNVAKEKKAKTSRRGVQAIKAPAGSALVVRNAIRATPAAVDLMCKLLRLVAGRSVLLWVGCGCGEEILAILREVGRGVYVVALEKNEHDLGTFRSTLVAAEGVHPVDAKTDVFRLQSNGAKVRLVCVDADSLSNKQFAALAPQPHCASPAKPFV